MPGGMLRASYIPYYLIINHLNNAIQLELLYLFYKWQNETG